MGAFSQGTEKLNIDRVMFVINTVSIAFGVVAVGCITAGILTLVYVTPNFYFPYSTGSGIWTGLVTVLISIFGLKFTTIYREVNDPAAARCYIVMFYTLIISDITCGSLHMSYSGIGLHYCIANTLTASGELYCDDETSRLTIVCGLNVICGMFILVVSLATMLYLVCGRKLQALSGRPADDGSYMTCCGGSCKCYYNTVTY